MTYPIFCPSNHLVLSGGVCPQCGWRRPPERGLGELAWGPLNLGAGLGGPGRGVFARPALAQGVAVFPLNNGELIGLTLSDGRARWRVALEAGQALRALFPDTPPGSDSPRRLLAAISDERSIEHDPGPGRLVRLDPLSGGVETFWQAQGHLISYPALSAELILARDSGGAVVALQRAAPNVEAWRAPVQAWWSQAPLIAGGSVLISDGRAMHGQSELIALDLLDGALRWRIPTNGLLSALPAWAGQSALIYNGRSQVLGLDLRSGEQLWKNEYARLYAAPISGLGRFFISVRGPGGDDQPGHYLMLALQPETGKEIWRCELPAHARPRLTPLLTEGMLLLGCDDGSLLACDPQDGHLHWQTMIGNDEEPPRMELTPANGLLLVGTWSGQVSAIQIGEAPEEVCAPEIYLQRGDYESAAASLALCGDFQQAAKIYHERIQQPLKALALLDHARLYGEAGELGRACGLHSQALKYFELAKDLPNQALELVDLGDHLEAARRFEAAGDLPRAAYYYEFSGSLLDAIKAYGRVDDVDAIQRVIEGMPDDIRKIEAKRGQGRLAEAGHLALEIGEHRMAADLFQQSGEKELELQALIRLNTVSPETWSLPRLAELARSLGRFQQEAEAQAQLGESQKAAEAYQRAAIQAEQRSPDDEPEIARLYQLAANHYYQHGLEEQNLYCRHQAIRYGHQPLILLEGGSTSTFREMEFNMFTLMVKNVGYGVAHEVHIQPAAGRFEVEESNTLVRVPHLAPDSVKEIKLFLRPKKESVGEAVALVLEWFWQDAQGQRYNDRLSQPVVVRRQGESPSSGPPVVIHAQTYVQGTYVGGDKIESGAQKGGRVEIQHGGGVRLQPSGARGGATRICPNCSLPVEAGLKFCQGCGKELSPDTRRRKSSE